jgi:hypothetical protein
MSQWTFLCILGGFVADLAAIVLLLTGGGGGASAPIVISLGAVASAGAGALLMIKQRSAASAAAESPVPPSVVSLESPAASVAAPELPGGDPLDDKPWLNLVEENVALFDELDRQRADFDVPRQEVADHVICRLQEILERSGVETISGDDAFDRNRHRPEGTARVLPGAMVTETLSPGFRVGKRVLRRARVRVSNPAVTDRPSY